jgi:hypothetical protein
VYRARFRVGLGVPARVQPRQGRTVRDTESVEQEICDDMLATLDHDGEMMVTNGRFDSDLVSQRG